MPHNVMLSQKSLLLLLGQLNLHLAAYGFKGITRFTMLGLDIPDPQLEM
jgi:hypothetical protein